MSQCFSLSAFITLLPRCILTAPIPYGGSTQARSKHLSGICRMASMQSVLNALFPLKVKSGSCGSICNSIIIPSLVLTPLAIFFSCISGNIEQCTNTLHSHCTLFAQGRIPKISFCTPGNNISAFSPTPYMDLVVTNPSNLYSCTYS